MRFFLLFIVVLLFSCKKEKSCETCVSECKAATIIDAGVVGADGCGWVVKVDDNHSYHPDFLPASFKEDNLAVQVCYEITQDEFICGIAGMSMPVIHITSITK